MKNIQKSGADSGEKQLVPITVRLSESVYSGLHGLSKEYGVSFAHTVRLAAEGELENYFGSVRYKDRTQAAEIMAAGRELAEICRDIVNNARRIGFNFSQELRLNDAKKKYNGIRNDSSKGKLMKELALNDYIKETNEIEKTCLDKEELKNIIERFEAATKKVEVLSRFIHE